MTETPLNIFSTDPPAALTNAPAPPQPPNSVEAAKAARQERINDPAWCERYMSGDMQARAEMKGFHQTISNASAEERTEAALAGAVASNGVEMTSDENPLTTSQLSGAVRELEKWYEPEIIRSFLKGDGVPAAKRQEALRAREMILRDRDFQRGLKEGHSEKLQLVRNMNMILSCRVIEDEK